MLRIDFEDLGRLDYAPAYARQCELVDEIVAARESDPGVRRAAILLVEHPPLITVTRRPGAAEHVTASADALRQAGVAVLETDRGGDVTYHGPGQLVVYPIVDLNAFGLRLHDYMRLLERAVIRAIGAFGVRGHRDVCATGVWVGGSETAAGADTGCGAGGAKICAMGVRVRKWVSMHGLAINVSTNLEHFGLIVPCGLVGRSVTSLERELGELCPSMDAVKREVREALRRELENQRP